MSKVLTVGELKKALENVPDDLEVELWSDSGVDQSDDDSEVVVEDAFRHQYTLPDGQTYEDGTNMSRKEKDDFIDKKNCLLVQKYSFKEILEVLKGESDASKKLNTK